jgi:hypothetical protein
MAELSSSHDLHPSSGGRFVFERIEPSAAIEYRVQVFLPAGARFDATLAWVEGVAALREHPDNASVPDELIAWARSEVLKLARVLHRDPKPRLSRWRG